MAMRRPAPPRLPAACPGAAQQLAQPARAAQPAPPVPPAQSTQPVQPAQSAEQSVPGRRTARRTGRRTGRRALLLAGAAAAVAVPVTAGTLLRREKPGALSAGPAQSVPGPGADEKSPFEDLAADTPGYEAMLWAHQTGVQPALSSTDYAPGTEISRGDVAVALHRLAGAPVVDLGTIPALFVDLGEDPSRVSAVLWLHGRGALWGDAELRVHPDAPATRDCTAMMLAALMRPALVGMGVTWDASAEVSLPQPEDLGSAQPDVAWLAAAGIAPDSYAADDWTGDAGVTRAELAVSLHRADSVISGALG